MGIELARATTAAEVEAVQRLRHEVYVEEMGRYGGNDERRLAEPEDAHSWIFYARDDDRVVAATRTTWGGDGFSDRQVDQYQLAPFLDEIPHELMGVGERNTVLASHRGTGVLDELLAFSGAATAANGLLVVFGCCEPHLLSLYLRMGSRPYAQRNINSPSAGYLIPLISFVPDPEALRGVGRNTGPEELPPSVEAVLARGQSTVISEVVSNSDDYLGEIRRTLGELDARRVSVFDGLTDDEVERCVARSTILCCAAGDRVLKRGGTARNIFVVLDGTLEVRDGDVVVNVLTPGDVLGEVAFLMERPRAFDVDAVVDDARVLGLSDGALRKMVAEEPTVAAKLLLNLSKMLCVKLVRAS